MRVSVFGLGHVDWVTAACLAKDGHILMGVVNPQKVDSVAAGRAPIIETRLDDLLNTAVDAGRFAQQRVEAELARPYSVPHLLDAYKKMLSGDVPDVASAIPRLRPEPIMRAE